MKRFNRARKVVTFLFVFSFLLFIAPAADAYLIIDHTCTDISQVPSYWINEGRSLFRISYGHTSHGSQIVTGMTVLKNQYGSLYDFNYSGSSGALSLHDYEPSGDLGNPDRTAWAQATRNLLDTPGNDRNLIMWSWCGQVSSATEADITTYLNLMSQLEADYPDVTFIYMTGHLDGSGEEGNLHQRNNQIRNHVISHGGVLFDFADIESYDPDGNYFLNRGADDGCDYDGGNWAVKWCASNPGECASCDCAHSQCLNCQRKGKAFWWMMAKLAGWGTTSTTTTIADPNDLDGDGVLNAADNCPTTPNPDQADTYPPGGNGCGDACECHADCNADKKVDLSDLVMMKQQFMWDCSQHSSCEGDCNYDNKVDLSDLVMMKGEFLRSDCPVCP